MVTFITAPEKSSTLIEFYKRVQPGGWWKPIAKSINVTKESVVKGFFMNWIAGIALIYGMTFAIGNLIFGNWINSALLILLSMIGFCWIWFKTIKKLD